VNRPVHSAGAPTELQPAEIQAQRRRARRMALLLVVVAACIYLAFILATGLRS